MKVDIDNGDMYYNVYCDGVKLDKCLRADSEEGYAECYELDNDENVIVLGHMPSTYICRGVIEIESIYDRDATHE